MNIEVEIRSFISKEKYYELLKFFNDNAKFLKEDYQETSYFDCEEDLRIQKNNFKSKVWLKKGQLHDDYREEIEIEFDKDKFKEMENLFKTLGYNTEIKWFRNRHQFYWKGITVCLDYTRGYGYIIELEKMSTEINKDESLIELKQKMGELKINITSKEKFKEKFEDYRVNWKILTSTN